jgi:hypothetical protein
MPEFDLDQLRRQLLGSGVAPRHVRRAVAELGDHIDDLEREELAHGLSRNAAKQEARRRMGANERLAAQYTMHRDLKSWPFRYRRVARVVLPLAYVLLLPTVPVTAGAASFMVIARWCTCLLLSALVTAGMLLAMQYSITLT